MVKVISKTKSFLFVTQGYKNWEMAFRKTSKFEAYPFIFGYLDLRWPESFFANSLSRDFCFLLSFVGVLMTTSTTWSPSVPLLGDGMPSPGRRNTSPGCVPLGILSFLLPFNVGTVILSPKAAWTNEMGIRQITLLLSRLKKSWGWTWIKT